MGIEPAEVSSATLVARLTVIICGILVITTDLDAGLRKTILPGSLLGFRSCGRWRNLASSRTTGRCWFCSDAATGSGGARRLCRCRPVLPMKRHARRDVHTHLGTSRLDR